MFRNPVTSTPFTGENSAIFNYVSGDPFSGDVSFISTLRALLYKRIPEGEVVNLYSVKYDKDRDGSSYVATHISNLPEGSVLTCNVYTARDSSAATIDAAFKAVEAQIPAGYEPVEKVNVFFAKSFKSLTYVNRERKTCLIFVHNMGVQKYHIIQCAIPFYLPWYFEGENKHTAEDFQFLFTLSNEPESGPYMAALDKVAEGMDLRGMRIRSLLTGFEKKTYSIRLENTRRSIERIVSEMEDLNRKFAEKNLQRNELNVTLMGLECAMEQQSDSELLRYFSANKNLYLTSVSDSSMDFIARGVLSVYDADFVDSLLKRENSFIYRTSVQNHAKLKRFWKALLADRTIRLRLVAAYTFDLHGSVGARSRYHFTEEHRDWYPNPHIQHYTCMGDYASSIQQLILANDYIGALEQTIGSAVNLNLHDSTVMGRFVDDLFGSWYKKGNIIELPDGTATTVEGAFKWLEEHDYGKTEEKED